jgi:hypothetical protein
MQNNEKKPTKTSMALVEVSKRELRLLKSFRNSFNDEQELNSLYMELSVFFFDSLCDSENEDSARFYSHTMRKVLTFFSQVIQ